MVGFSCMKILEKIYMHSFSRARYSRSLLKEDLNRIRGVHEFAVLLRTVTF
jgi:hypothetical protein